MGEATATVAKSLGSLNREQHLRSDPKIELALSEVASNGRAVGIVTELRLALPEGESLVISVKFGLEALNGPDETELPVRHTPVRRERPRGLSGPFCNGFV